MRLCRDCADLLRVEGRFGVEGAPKSKTPILQVVLLIAGCGALHGLFIGSWQLSAVQMMYSGLKLPILLGLGFAVCLPSFCTMQVLAGLSGQVLRSVRAILLSQAAVGLALVSLAPVLAFCYGLGAGGDDLRADYTTFKVLNALAFLLASLAGQVVLMRHFRPLIAVDRRNRILLLVWLALYWGVTIQLAWFLRPFIGLPGEEPTFLRHAGGVNAFGQILDILREFFG
jgi:hypothetical protein